LPKQLTILLTEGNATLREVAARFLISQGYSRPHSKRRNKAALAILAMEEIHLLFLDLTSPETNGLAVLQYVRRERQGRFPYVIVLSGVMTERTTGKYRNWEEVSICSNPFFSRSCLSESWRSNTASNRGESQSRSFVSVDRRESAALLLKNPYCDYASPTRSR